jgi:serine/threonine protein kinase
MSCVNCGVCYCDSDAEHTGKCGVCGEPVVQNEGSSEGVVVAGGGISRSNRTQLASSAATPADFARFSSDVADALQHFLARYERSLFSPAEVTLLRRLAGGGMGDIFDAMLARDGDPVVVKIFKTDKTLLRDNIRECEVAMRARHENIVRAIGLMPMGTEQQQRAGGGGVGGAGDPRVALLMERCDGSLEDVLRACAGRGGVPFYWVHAYAVQIARGLAYLHVDMALQKRNVPPPSKPPQEAAAAAAAAAAASAPMSKEDDDQCLEERVIWLDGAPKNILIRVLASQQHHQCLLADYGLSRATRLEHSSTGVTLVGASPCYASHEQLDQWGKAAVGEQRHRVAPTHDVYAFGAILWHMIKNRRPFDGCGIAEICRTHLVSLLHPIEREGCPPELVKLCEDCLHPEPKLRPQDGKALLARLEAIPPPRPFVPPPAFQTTDQRLGDADAVAGSKTGIIQGVSLSQ